MKRNSKNIVAIILAVTIPIFILLVAVMQIITVIQTGSSTIVHEWDLERTKIWIALITSIATGLLVWIANKNGKNE